MSNYYQVFVSDGCVVDGQGHAVRPSGINCGHKHRTEEAASRCADKLRAYDAKTRTCSAKWYNAQIVELAADGRYPERPESFPPNCARCGLALSPSELRGGVCEKCGDELTNWWTGPRS